MSTDDLLAWLAIGVAASLAVMTWPFRRGSVGIVANLLAGAAGAIFAGLLSHVLFPTAAHESMRLIFAAAGALLALALVHAAWLGWSGRMRRPQTK